MSEACRPSRPDILELEKGAIRTHGAWDALVVMVHPKNPVNGLTTEQVYKIFKGEIRNWKEVGGELKSNKVVVRPPFPIQRI